MPAFTKDPALADHLAWLGYLQPEGLVVSAPALVDAQVVIDRSKLGELQRGFTEYISEMAVTDSDTGDTRPGVADSATFLTDFLGWPADLLVGWDAAQPLPDSLSVALPDFQETLAPSFAVTNPQPKEGASRWLLLVQRHAPTVDLEKPTAASERGWHASPAKKFERLLRETQVPIGLLTNGVAFRLIYAPPKENSGALTFPVGAMSEVSGRLILGAFHLLLNSWTLFNAPSEARLPALLQRSRDYQASVSEVLAEQVLHALYELLRGLEAADEKAKGALLRDLAAQRPEDIYGGLVTVLLRLVFVLFAEDRGLLPMSGIYVRYYAVHGLFERLRADAERYPDTMDHRFGAWAQLLALFRLIYGGCKHPELTMPAREGHLFDPDRYPFLEGRAHRDDPVAALPLVSDGVLQRILEKLCVLDSERVSYRTLDVEEIGSVYQTIMGFGVEVVAGTAVALKGKRKKGAVPAAPVVDLEALLAQKPAERLKYLGEQADTKLTGEAERLVKEAAIVGDLLAALGKRIDRNATPSPAGNGGLVLQPNDERRRSGSHYTPRSFTEPIVRKTLEPVLSRLGNPPTPAQILDLKIADIAVGSAAFLVEACRQLGDALVRAWRAHGGRPPVPADETEELLAMRLVAQRCLYGVDRNPMAVDLAKLSLWLATLARDHPFTFLDHNIRCGDSLVGLTAEQIACFTWETPKQDEQFGLIREMLYKRIKAATAYRRDILEGGDFVLPALKAQKLKLADEALDEVRFAGDLIISAFFAADKDKARKANLDELRDRYVTWHSSRTYDPSLKPRDAVEQLRSGNRPVWPFHWQVEFPEVFGGEKPGFDAIAGNPPFLGGSKLSSVCGKGYMAWLAASFPESHGKSDLVAYFFRRAFSHARESGTLGLISTNTIRQGDTRQTGLRWIRKQGGWIYIADLRRRWPGSAAVVVSVVHIRKGTRSNLRPLLNGKEVTEITAYLFYFGSDENPACLAANRPLVHSGTNINGEGFVLSSQERAAFIRDDPSCEGQIRPYLGAKEMNESPQATYSRYAIHMEGMAEADVRRWPSLYHHLNATVRLQRLDSAEERLRENWWLYSRPARELYEKSRGMSRLLASGRAGSHVCFVFQSPDTIFSDALTLFLFQENAGFAVLQSRIHEYWARFFSSSLKDDNRYIPEDCFETFPIPLDIEQNVGLESSGRNYYEFRATLMVRTGEGLTEIYNRFHDPLETAPDFLRLRELHALMDGAVLDAYGWSDIPTDCEFLLDYDEDEDDEAEGKARKRRKPWRYRWPDAIRDEVLARLLKLNAERAEQERLTDIAAGASSPKPDKRPVTGAKRGHKPKPPPPGVAPSQPELIPPEQGDLFA